MAVEIERKFLLKTLPRLDESTATDIVQAYLRADAGGSVRIRVAGDRAWLTIKGPAQGRKRHEWEYPVPAADAREMLAMAISAPVRKRRYTLEENGYVWEIDVFRGLNAGLTVAEVELPSENAAVQLPGWIGEEVTDDPRYLNSSLSRRPYAAWASEVSTEEIRQPDS